MEDIQRTPRPTHKRHGPSISARTVSLGRLGDYDDNSMLASSSTSPVPSSGFRFMSSVKRSLSVSHGPTVKRKQTGVRAERQVPARFRQHDASTAPPSIEQIAMGLHLSRTPHLHQAGSTYSPYGRTSQGSQHHHERPAATVPLPPPPARSSLKKPSTIVSASSSSVDPGLSTASSTTITSTAPSTPQSTRSGLSLKTRMSRFLPGARTVSAPASAAPSSPQGSTDSIPQKKAVRFLAVDTI